MLFAAVIAYVPLDDRPVTRQLPQMLGRIAGREVIEPPRQLLGNYLTFGEPDAIIQWLNGPQTRGADAYVISTDMLAYGGLVAARTPSTTYDDAYFRLRSLEQIRRAHPHAWTSAFGTIMRLAPSGVPAVGDAAHFFAAYPEWKYLQEYANLHDPPLPSEAARARQLEQEIGIETLDGYLSARRRDYGIDLFVQDLTSRHVVDRSVLGQDDAGPFGLHVKDVRALQQHQASLRLDASSSIEPGADELGMALVANALAREARWQPRIAVRYSTQNGANYQDPLEFAPVSVAIDDLIELCGGVRDDAVADITLFVRLPKTSRAEDDALVDAMHATGGSRALADLSFLTNDYAGQGAFAERLLGDGTMASLDAYASWNTNANTVGTALAEAVAAGAGRRMRSYDARAHKTFTINRVIDDVAFHTIVRPKLNTMLDAQGVSDHTYLSPDVAVQAGSANRAWLWPYAEHIAAQLASGDHVAAMTITLPWRRTFETEIDLTIAPNI